MWSFISLQVVVILAVYTNKIFVRKELLFLLEGICFLALAMLWKGDSSHVPILWRIAGCFWLLISVGYYYKRRKKIRQDF